MPVSRKRTKGPTRTSRCRNCIHSMRNVVVDGGDHLDGWYSTTTVKLGCCLDGDPVDTAYFYTQNLPCFKPRIR